MHTCGHIAALVVLIKGGKKRKKGEKEKNAYRWEHRRACRFNSKGEKKKKGGKRKECIPVGTSQSLSF
jgi:hypothetical protein